MSNPLGSTESLPVFDLDTGAGSDKHPALGVMFADAGGHSLVSAADPLPVTDVANVADDDDNAIAEGQTLPLNIVENYVHNGTEWIRNHGGVDNAVAVASPQGAFVGGVVTDPLDALADGDVSLLHFDTSGRLHVNAEGVTDDDDNAIASGQTTGLVIDIGYIFDGTDWIRQQGGIDNAPAPASPQGAFVGGVVTDPAVAIADGDVSLLHFDLLGQLLVSSADAPVLEEDDDDSIAIGQTAQAVINLPYFSNLDDTSIWQRWTGRDDDDAVPEGDGSPTILGLTHVHDGVDWGRVEGVRDNAAAPATPRGVMTEGVAETALPAFTAGDGVIDRFTDEGAKIITRREQEPFELAKSQVALAASGTFVATIQQDDLFLGSRGLTLLHALVHYAGVASSVTVFVAISLDGGGTFITTDTFVATTGVAVVIRDLPVSLGDRVRITVRNDDGVNPTGVTNISAYLTQNN